jgi:hypothetical protein
MMDVVALNPDLVYLCCWRGPQELIYGAYQFLVTTTTTCVDILTGRETRERERERERLRREAIDPELGDVLPTVPSAVGLRPVSSRDDRTLGGS